jgi:hypothetical protein
MQFEIFNDSHSVAGRNDVIVALQQCDAAAAHQAWQAHWASTIHKTTAWPHFWY